MSIFEIVMLLCFGSAWPFAIYKSFVSRTARGKSAFFSYVVIVGYLSGIAHKLIYAYDQVIWLYIADLVMVLIDLALYWRNTRLDRSVEIFWRNSHLDSPAQVESAAASSTSQKV